MTSRVSTNQIYSQASTSVDRARRKQSQTAEKISTQKEITRPSNDPQGWRVSKEMKDEVAIRDVLGKNANIAMSFLQATETVFSQVQEKAIRAYELMIRGIDKLDGDEIQGIGAEIEEVYESVIQTLNTRYGARTLLGGYKTSGHAFDKDGKFLGDEGVIKVELERGRLYEVNVSGDAAIKGKRSEKGVDLLEGFQRAIQGIRDKDKVTAGSSIDIFKAGIEQLSTERALIGARMAGIEQAINTNESHTIELKDLSSQIEEIDVAKVFSEMARDQTALNATLHTSQKLLKEVPPDLLYK